VENESFLLGAELDQPGIALHKNLIWKKRRKRRRKRNKEKEKLLHCQVLLEFLTSGNSETWVVLWN